MTEEERRQAIEIMARIPQNLRRNFREANALVAMLGPLCAEKEDDDPRPTTITISTSMAGAICLLAEGLRDAMSVTAQQTRHILHLMGAKDVWNMPNGYEDVDD